MEVKREIQFFNSMTLDKRAAEFAYLRKKCFDAHTKGLFPTVDFEPRNPSQAELTTTKDIYDIVGSEESTFDIKVMIEDGSDLRFYNLGSDSESNTYLANVDYECGIMGNDGVHICLDDDTVRRVNHQNSNAPTSDGTFTDARPDIAGFDGLYYWWLSSNEIYRQLGSAAPTIAFNNLGMTPIFVDFYNDQMVIYGQQGKDVVVLFWDKSDTDLFDKRILVKNSRLIAGGVVDGRVMLVTAVGNGSNPKEFKSRMVVNAYDGEKFVEINSIKCDSSIDYERETSQAVGVDRIIFSVENNIDTANTDLYKDFIYEVRADGAIEVVAEPDVTTYGDVHVVRIFFDNIVYAHTGVGAQPPLIMRQYTGNDNYDDYEDFTDTEYITNFLNNPYNSHKLEAFAVAFEKLYEQTDTGVDPVTGEELDVYYRVSERDDWTQLMNVTVEKVKDNVNANRDQSTEYASDTQGLPEQRYQVSQMPDESPLPEFNEIQFKFVLKRGFSIIGAWYGYDYISRNTLA
jgi:hypothetical protein